MGEAIHKKPGNKTAFIKLFQIKYSKERRLEQRNLKDIPNLLWALEIVWEGRKDYRQNEKMGCSQLYGILFEPHWGFWGVSPSK